MVFGTIKRLLKHKTAGIIDSSHFFDLDKVEKEIQENVIEEVERLLVEEMLICRQEGTPTSRLTSLYMKLQRLKP